MALPHGINGFTSRGGLEFAAKLWPLFLHQREDIGSAFIDSRLDPTVTVAHTLT